MADPLSDIWTQFVGGVTNPTIPTITFPASPGVAWELVAIHAEAVNLAATAYNAGVNVNGAALGSVELPAVINSKDTLEWQGTLLGVIGAALTIAFSAAPPVNVFASLAVQARAR